MIGTTAPEYVFIRISISLLRLIAPASILYLAYSAYVGQFFITPWIAVLAVPEAIFFLCFYLPRKRLIQQLVPVPPLTRSERQVLFQRCATCLPDSTYPTGWFLSPEIKRDNVVEWLLWALFSMTLETAMLNEEWPEWEEELAGYIETIEKLVGRRFEPGRNDLTRSMRIAFDRVLMCHRPLVWYAIVGLVDVFTAVSLALLGFKHYDQGKWFRAFPFRLFTFFSRKSATSHFSYWYRPHTSTTKRPIVFIHGIGIGLYPYVGFCRDLVASDPSVGILLIELLPISMHITCETIPPRTTTLRAIEDTLDQLGIGEATLAGHSFGTVISSWVLRSFGAVPAEPLPPAPLLPVHEQRSDGPSNTGKDLASRFTSLLLIDPIPILLHLPDVAYNFLYREPKRANEWQLWYFASRDADVARMLGRHFFWRDCVLWKDDLLPPANDDSSSTGGWPGHVAVVLSGADQIVASETVWKYLTGSSSLPPLEEETSPVDPLSTTAESKVFHRWSNTEDGSRPRLQVLYYPDLDHATVFDTKQRRLGLVAVLEDFTRVD